MYFEPQWQAIKNIYEWNTARLHFGPAHQPFYNVSNDFFNRLERMRLRCFWSCHLNYCPLQFKAGKLVETV